MNEALLLILSLMYPDCPTSTPLHAAPLALVCAADNPAVILGLIEAESGFCPGAVSARGAVGLMQVLPSTAGVPAEWLKVPLINVAVGIMYFEGLSRQFGGDLNDALNAYNKGPGGAKSEIKNNIVSSYAKKVLQLSKKYVD